MRWRQENTRSCTVRQNENYCVRRSWPSSHVFTKGEHSTLKYGGSSHKKKCCVDDSLPRYRPAFSRLTTERITLMLARRLGYCCCLRSEVRRDQQECLPSPRPREELSELGDFVHLWMMRCRRNNFTTDIYGERCKFDDRMAAPRPNLQTTQSASPNLCALLTSGGEGTGARDVRQGRFL